MKKILFIMLIMIFATLCFSTNVWANSSVDNVQAAWMATVFGLDFPSTKDDVTAQKNEYIVKLEGLQAAGINTVVVQVRPKADALYKSNINPWSDVLTGTQGKDPGYDPLAFMIEEAHKRGMSFHAWLNPYRVTTSGTDLNALSENHPARLHPNWLISYNNALYYNPALQAVKKHIVETVQEIVNNYDVDAIHFDDYFYPANYPLPPGEGQDGVIANNRRQHVNEMLRQVSEAIRSLDKEVLFGVSPTGIWKNNSSDPVGSATSGNQSYYTVCADTKTWIKNEWVDYVVPQVYWETGHKAADYETLVKWWAEQVKGTKVALYIGHGTYKEVVAKEIDLQLKINQKYPEVQGSFYYGLGNLLDNKAGCKDKIALSTKTTNPTKPTSRALPSVKIGNTTANVLNIRSGGGLQYAVVAKAARGTQVAVLNSQQGWYRVMLPDGKVGWASADYVRVVN